MSTKAQHAKRYQPVPALLKKMREEAGLTQRALGEALGLPQSWVYKCEVLIRRVDVAEFADWAEACGVEPTEAMARLRNTAASKKRRRR